LGDAFDPTTRQPRKRHHRLPSRSFLFFAHHTLVVYRWLRLRTHPITMGAPPGVSHFADLLGPQYGCIDSKHVRRNFEANTSRPFLSISYDGMYKTLTNIVESGCSIALEFALSTRQQNHRPGCICIVSKASNIALRID